MSSNTTILKTLDEVLTVLEKLEIPVAIGGRLPAGHMALGGRHKMPMSLLR